MYKISLFVFERNLFPDNIVEMVIEKRKIVFSF